MTAPIDLKSLPTATGQTIHDPGHGRGLRWSAASGTEAVIDVFDGDEDAGTPGVVRIGPWTLTTDDLERLALLVQRALTPPLVPTETTPDAPLALGPATRAVPQVHTRAELLDATGLVVGTVYDLERFLPLVSATHVALLSEWPNPAPTTLREWLGLDPDAKGPPVVWTTAGLSALFGAAGLATTVKKATRDVETWTPAPPTPLPMNLTGLDALAQTPKWSQPGIAMHVGRKRIYAASGGDYARYLRQAGWQSTLKSDALLLEGEDPDFERKFRLFVDLVRFAATRMGSGWNSAVPDGFMERVLFLAPDSESRALHLRTLKDSPYKIDAPTLPSSVAGAMRVAQTTFDEGKHAVVVAVGASAAAALALEPGDVPVVLVAPEWRTLAPERRASQRTVILHSEQDETVPVEDSVELARLSDLRPSAVRRVGASHRMDNPAALKALRLAVDEAMYRK
ncbi:MAG: hypothetical protein RL199_2340 [Pseudomonadota bacterium]|jgi:hypothetical protein